MNETHCCGRHPHTGMCVNWDLVMNEVTGLSLYDNANDLFLPCGHLTEVEAIACRDALNAMPGMSWWAGGATRETDRPRPNQGTLVMHDHDGIVTVSGSDKEFVTHIIRAARDYRPGTPPTSDPSRELVEALRRLTFCARTAGGWKPDADLMAACEVAENLLACHAGATAPGATEVNDA